MKKNLLFCALFIAFPILALSQIEKLEVEGAITIGNSIGIQPEAGTIRWNLNTCDFEGYDGFNWLSLTSSSSAMPLNNRTSQIRHSDRPSHHSVPQEHIELINLPDRANSDFHSSQKRTGIRIDILPVILIKVNSLQTGVI